MTTPAEAAEPAETQSTSRIELLTFRIGDQEYSIDIMSVREIRSWIRATSLPHAPAYVRGVINLRGTVLPVLDLARRLGLEAAPLHERSVIIVVDVGGRLTGLLVDAVSDILALPRDALQPAPEVAAEDGPAFVTALTVVEERMIRVLDPRAILPETIEGAA